MSDTTADIEDMEIDTVDERTALTDEIQSEAEKELVVDGSLKKGSDAEKSKKKRDDDDDDDEPSGFVARAKQLFVQTGMHIGLLAFCVVYIYLGAHLFRYLESFDELRVRDETAANYKKMVDDFLDKMELLRDIFDDDSEYNASLYALMDEYEEQYFSMFNNPISANYFDSIFYRNGDYLELWTIEASLLFTSTTMVPVGFGLITPMTRMGRIMLIVYASIGIPLAVVTMSDIGRFLCDSAFKLFNQKVGLVMAFLLTILFLYPLVGGVIIHHVSTLSLFDAIYYCCITILTVGFGDISPPIPVIYLIFFIVSGVTLVTITIDVVGANAVHNIHMMGRHIGNVKDAAGKMMQMAQKINLNKGIIHMGQLGVYAKMGMMRGRNGTLLRRRGATESPRKSFYDPGVDFVLIDGKVSPQPSQYRDGFSYHDDDSELRYF